MGRSILVVDDNVDIAESMAMLLEMYGYTTYTACDATSAMTMARTHLPDVILLDIGLPGTDGYTVANTLKSEAAFADTIFIAMTGYGSDQDREMALQAGFDHHLLKPTDMDQLLALLHCE